MDRCATEVRPESLLEGVSADNHLHEGHADWWKVLNVRPYISLPVDSNGFNSVASDTTLVFNIALALRIFFQTTLLVV